MKILLAPNSFKECASASEVTELFATSLNKHGISNLIRMPISDGGDGFLDVCAKNFDLHIKRRVVNSCFNDSKRNISIGLDKKGTSVYLEVAEFIGLRTIPKSRRNPMILNSTSLGEFLKKLVQRKTAIKNITIGIGGTGTNDLGLGLCGPFGLKLYDRNGSELAIHPKNYHKVEKIILPRNIKPKINVVLDVKIKLFGKRGTSKVFAKQKGASDKEIEILEFGVKNILRVLKRDHGIDFTKALIGAGGGLTLGLMLISKVKVITSQNFLIEKLHLQSKIKSADIVLSGEGKIDNQSYMEKATGIVINESLKQNKKVILIVGASELPENKRRDGLSIYSLTGHFKSAEKAIKSYKKGIKELICEFSNQLK